VNTPEDFRKAARDLIRTDPKLAIVPKGPAPPDLLSQLFTDTGNAERFVLRFSNRARFVHAFRAWLVWDGRRWARDDSDQVRVLAKNVMIELLQQATSSGNEAGQKFGRGSLDSRRITNMLREAQPELAIAPDNLDQHPDLLVFLNGTVNLRTGDLGPHEPDHFITKMVHHNYVPGAACPLFLSTLARLMGATPDATEEELARADRLVSTLQVCLGYTLTGHTREKVVFIFFGGGNNGKTTILSLFLKLLEELAVLLQIETLMVRQENNNSQADLADLRGARFVMTSETEEGQRLAQGKLKKITQGMGKIKATRKYENPFEFQETHKLFIDGNHKPVIRGTDAAIWNRIFTIPFTVTIPKDEIDRELQPKLLAEAEGILAWAVTGSVLWYRHGLVRPNEIQVAVEAYRAEMDQVGRFIEERCIVHDGLGCYASVLYQAYKSWAESSGEHAISQPVFRARILEREELTSGHAENGTRYRGIGLRVGLVPQE
jgi:putative DNA primase/helicase